MEALLLEILTDLSQAVNMLNSQKLVKFASPNREGGRTTDYYSSIYNKYQPSHHSWVVLLVCMWSGPRSRACVLHGSWPASLLSYNYLHPAKWGNKHRKCYVHIHTIFLWISIVMYTYLSFTWSLQNVIQPRKMWYHIQNECDTASLYITLFCNLKM